MKLSFTHDKSSDGVMMRRAKCNNKVGTWVVIKGKMFMLVKLYLRRYQCMYLKLRKGQESGVYL